MNTAIVTGANGFIGSHLVLGLLERGWCVHALGRGAAGVAWDERMARALVDTGVEADRFGRLFCHEADLCRDDLGLGSSARAALPESGCVLVHVAGDTSFTPRDVAAQRRLNVDASVNVVRAMAGRLGRMVHVSTAYVSGDRVGPIRESELRCGQSFRNSYEESKCDAEEAVGALCGELGVDLAIVRPSIIVNDRRTGRASTFTHFNALVEVIRRLQDRYGLAEGEVVSERIRVVGDPGAAPNLAPIDSIMSPFIRIVESPEASGGTYHLCHPLPQTNAELVELLCEAFGVTGKLAVEFVAEMPKPLSRTEEMIVRSLRPYAPYLNSRSEFDLRAMRRIVPEFDSYFSAVDVPYLEKVIRFQRQKQ